MYSGVWSYAGAARRRVHLATVLLRPPSGHRPGRRQGRHARILQIDFHLAIAQVHASPQQPGTIYMINAGVVGREEHVNISHYV